MRIPPMGMPPGIGAPNQGMMNPFGAPGFPNLRTGVTPYPNEQDEKKK